MHFEAIYVKVQLVYPLFTHKKLKLTEAEIIEGCLKQKPAAQEALYKLYSARLLAICTRYAHTSFEAEDIFQEAFIKVFKNIDQYKGQGSFEGWLKHIFVNTAINHFHKSKKHNNHQDPEDYADTVTSDTDIIGSISADELTAVISKLPEGYRMVFNLYVVEGFNHKEIADMLGISEGTSKSQYAKAKAYLKKLLTQLRYPHYADE